MTFQSDSNSGFKLKRKLASPTKDKIGEKYMKNTKAIESGMKTSML